MEEKIFKADFFRQLYNTLLKTIVISIIFIIIINLLSLILPSEYMMILYLFNTNYLIICISLIYSIFYVFSYQKIKIGITDKSFFIYKRKNKEEFDLDNYNFIFIENIDSSFLGINISKHYFISITDNKGFYKRVCCYSFNKTTYVELKKIINERKLRQ